MISDQKILLTGGSGRVAMQLGRRLAPDNQVWAMARFSDPASRAKVEAAGMKALQADISGPLDIVPDDFDLVLHLSHTRRGPAEFVEAIDVNAVAAGLLLQHCRSAKAALVMSSTAVYSPPVDVFTPLMEEGEIGGARAPWAPSSPVSKVSLEAVARFAAAAFDIPVTIARLNTCYGLEGGMPVTDMEAIVAGQLIQTFADPYPHTPIHYDDMFEQLEALLGAATTRGEIINWCGDEVVTQREWCEQVALMCGRPAELVVRPLSGTPNGNVGDNTKRLAITGPCHRRFTESYAEIYSQRFH